MFRPSNINSSISDQPKSEKNMIFNDSRAKKYQALLDAVAQDNIRLVLQIASSCPNLLFNCGQVTDDSGRYFPSISPVVLAAWRLNPEMITVMQDLIDGARRCHVDKMKMKMTNAIDDLREKGVDYIYRDIKYCSEQISLDDILNKMGEYITHYDDWVDKERSEFWCNVVGEAQQELPRHVVNKFLRNENSTQLDENDKQKQRDFEPCYFNTFTGRVESWYQPCGNSKRSFAIIHGDNLKYPQTTKLPAAYAHPFGLSVTDNLKELQVIINEIHGEIKGIFHYLRKCRQDIKTAISEPEVENRITKSDTLTPRR